MKIIQLTAENIKKLKAVCIRPDGSLVQITGANGQGKSSVLDAIFYALAGTKGLPSQPVRHGEEKAYIRLDLGDIVVTRRFTAGGGTSLAVEAESGARFPSPQKMLDDLLGALTFDPLEFSRMQPKQQLETLRGMVKLSVDIDALDGKNRTDYELRTEKNRELATARVRLAGIPLPPAVVPSARIVVADLVVKLDDAMSQNAAAEKQARERESQKDAIQMDIDRANRMIADGNRLLNDAEKLMKRSEDRMDALKKAPPIPEPIDTTDLTAQIRDAEKINQHVENFRRQTILLQMVTALEDDVAKLTQQMDSRSAAKVQAISEAAMPVPGLSFGDGEVLFNGVPFTQASSAEQLEVSVALAMAGNPKLRVLRIKDGEKLDNKHLALLEQVAIKNNFQIWIERVDESGKVGVVMEDGEAVQGGCAFPIPIPVELGATRPSKEKLVYKLTDAVFENMFASPPQDPPTYITVSNPGGSQSAEDLMALARKNQRDLRTKKD